MALASPPAWCGGPGRRSEVHPRQPRPALASGGAFSAQNNAGSLKGWAAGDGCFSKHRASFAKQALIPRPRGPRCLLGGRRGLGALFGRKRGLGDSGTKPGTQLAGAEGWPGQAGQAGMPVGAVVCRSRASPLQLGHLSAGGPGSLTSVEGAIGLQAVMVVHCLPTSLFGQVGGKTVV